MATKGSGTFYEIEDSFLSHMVHWILYDFSLVHSTRTMDLPARLREDAHIGGWGLRYVCAFVSVAMYSKQRYLHPRLPYSFKASYDWFRCHPDNDSSKSIWRAQDAPAAWLRVGYTYMV
jgi:hypothetical protein